MPKDIQCPICGSETILRTVKKGPNAGRRYHVCIFYPECKGKVPIGFKYIKRNRYGKKVIIVLVMLLAVFIMVGLASYVTYYYFNTGENESEAKLILVSWVLNSDEHGELIIEGIVRNDGNKRCNNGVVEFNVYDSAGFLIGVYNDFFSDLESGKTYAFEIKPNSQDREGEGYQFKRAECLNWVID